MFNIKTTDKLDFDSNINNFKTLKQRHKQIFLHIFEISL